MKRAAYALAYRGYQAVFALVRRLPPPLPQRFDAACHALKRSLFPGEHAALAPELAPAVASPSGEKPAAPSGEWRPPAIPDWAIEEMKQVALEVDPALYPYPWVIDSMTFWSIPAYEVPGLAYADLREALRHPDYTHIFVLPWLKPGGLDLEAIRLIEAAANVAGNRVLAITTENTDSPWATRLPAGVELCELGRRTAGFTTNESSRVLTRLALQLKPRVVHVSNSAIGWDMVARFGKALRSTARIFASCVCDDRTEYGTLMSYARLHLSAAYPNLDAVISDTAYYPGVLARDYGLPASLFRTVYFPADLPPDARFRAVAASKRVLWAGRIDHQKRPDILAAIARRLPDHEFHVFGSAVMDKGSYLPALESLPNVRYRGPFSGFASIPDEGWKCYLYTAEWDGLPNILMEATAAGLPIVAPDVGGVSEMIDDATGWLVARFDDVDAFVAALQAIDAQPAEALRRWENARARVATRHSHAAFESALEGIEGYLRAAPRTAAAVVPRRFDTALSPDLIIDVGMHHGQDTEFYLKKGFRVVAIEANPDLCARAAARLKEWTDAGRLTILNVGVGVEPGVMDFYRNLDKDDWSSFDKSWGTKEGTRAEIIKVRCVDFADILREHGMPYYLKIDVEGCDIAVVRTLHQFEHRPRYLSMEEHESHYFAELYSVGGRAFKVINQAKHWQHALPNPAREGKYVEQAFELGATGPFGEETHGQWLTFGESVDWYLKHVRNESEQLFATDGWYDIHIRIDR